MKVINTKESIAALLKCSACTFYLVYPDVQQQTDRSSCGLVELVVAHTLCEANDTLRLTYFQPVPILSVTLKEEHYIISE